jgi:hypothetical protein
MSWIIGLGGLLIAGLVLVLTYRERVASLRTRFYDEQITAYRALILTSDALTSAAVRYATDQGEPANDAERAGLWNQLSFSVWPNWATAVRVHVPFLPSSVLDPANSFNKAVLALAKPEALTVDLSQYRGPRSEIMRMAQAELSYAIRQAVGTDKLSEQNRRLIAGSDQPDIGSTSSTP